MDAKCLFWFTVPQFLIQALEKHLAHFYVQEYNEENQGLEWEKGTENASLCRKSDLLLEKGEQHETYRQRFHSL